LGLYFQILNTQKILKNLAFLRSQKRTSKTLKKLFFFKILKNLKKRVFLEKGQKRAFFSKTHFLTKNGFFGFLAKNLKNLKNLKNGQKWPKKKYPQNLPKFWTIFQKIREKDQNRHLLFCCFGQIIL
jgi:hypothetical protein